MPWKVFSSVTGGEKLSVADEKAYNNCASRLRNIASELSSLSILWMNAASSLQIKESTQANYGGQNLGNSITSKLRRNEQCVVPMTGSILTSAICSSRARSCNEISKRLEILASLLIRANNLYSDSEKNSREKFDNIVSNTVSVMPILSIPFFAGAGVAILKDRINNSGFKNFSKWSRSTASLQQGVMKGLSRNFILNAVTGMQFDVITGKQFNKLVKNSDAIKNNWENSVGSASESLSRISAPIKNKMQGNTLKVTKIPQSVNSSKNVFPEEGRTISQALRNLTELGSGNFGVKPPKLNPDAATIAIQRFRKKDGNVSWLVTIPGTDGKSHSPFGWEQNAEVMSIRSDTRKQADSTRMVVEAMRKSGIKSNDSVVLIGHSQGGIVAASIASDYSKQYNIKHVITAGSPIANHPIPKNISVTSIEMDDELVPNLDGKENPSRKNWVTVRGHASYVNKSSIKPNYGSVICSGSLLPKGKYNFGSLVESVPEEETLTHDLHYHEAAYDDASRLGSKAIRTQEKNFKDTINGELESTTLWQGVMQ